MEEKNKNILISSDSLKKLVENYQSKEVVSDFEKGINFYDVKKYKMEDIVLYPLYDERSYSKESLEILERSIRSNGFMFPLFLFEFEGKKCVINGVKRYLVAKALKSETVNGVVINGKVEDINNYIINNMLTNNDNGLVLAYAYDVLMKRFNLKEKDIRGMTKLSHGQINNTLRLLNLSKEVKKLVVNGKLSYAKARLLVVLSSEDQLRYANKFISLNLSVRECEKLVRGEEVTNTYEAENDKLIIYASKEKQEKIISLLSKEGLLWFLDFKKS